MRKIRFQFTIAFILLSLIANSQIKLIPTPVVGEGHTRYHGIRDINTEKILENMYYLRDRSRAAIIETHIPESNDYETVFDIFVDDNNIWDEYDNSAKDNAALDAHWALGQIYDYFLLEHGRESYDDENGLIKCIVHTDQADVSFWNNKEIHIGDGNSKYHIMATLEVIAHEFSHGIVESIIELEIGGETGAISESLGHIWGAVIEEYILPEKNEWLHGEDIAKNDQAYRSMNNPKLYNDPDTYQGINWIYPVGPEPDETNDYWGIHTNCGVMNYWFYLLTAGDGIYKQNDNLDWYSVLGIGMEKAARIVYDMQTKRLKSDFKFTDARTESINSAIYLFGSNSNEVVQVTNAWHAVGVGERYSYPIIGPSIVCYQTNSTFTINNLPPGSAINWTKSNNLSYVSGQGTNSYKVRAARASTSSSGSVSAVITPLKGETIPVSKSSWVGKAGQPTISPSGYPTIELQPGQYITIRATKTPGNPTSFNWWVTGSPCGVDIYSGTNSTSCTFEAMYPSWNNFYFNTTNVCGTSASAGGVIEVSDGGGGGMMKTLLVSPNPANDYIEAYIENLTEEEQLDNEKLQIKIVNSNSIPVYNGTTQQKKFQINTSSFSEGIYYLLVQYKNQKYSTTILISR